MANDIYTNFINNIRHSGISNKSDIIKSLQKIKQENEEAKRRKRRITTDTPYEYSR